METKKNRLIIATVAAATALPLIASAAQLRVSVTNLAPANGTYLTPVWVGFHDGNFDLFDVGSGVMPGLEALAEDGNTMPLSSAFAGAGTDQTISAMPFGPGTTVQTIFNLNTDGSNDYLSFASMLLASSDYFIGNANPRTISVAGLLDGTLSTASFTVVRAYDAGSEINDFATSAGNMFFGIPGGQTGNNQGADENGVAAVASGAQFVDFMNAAGVDTAALNFDNYTGIARIEISAVPAPAALPLLLTAVGALGGMGLRRKRPA